MGKPRKYKTAKALGKKVQAYFDSISYQVPMLREEPVRNDDGTYVLDDHGHKLSRAVPVVTADGKEAMQTIWITPPSLTALCLFLGIDRATWSRYGRAGEPEGIEEPDPDKAEAYRNTISRTRGRMEAYLESRLEEKGAQRGVIFNLQANFGWKERKEVGMDEPTRSAVALSGQGMTSAEKLEFLREAGVDVSAWE